MRSASPLATTSCSSATAASTDPRASTAPRWSRRGSTRATCSARPRSHPTPRAFRACATRLRDKGVDLAGYSLPERVDDLELARQALGYGPIDLVSESARHAHAMIYAWRYPQSIHRSVMIGVNPPGHFLWDAKTTGEQIGRYAALCAQATDCRNRTPRPRRLDALRLRQHPEPLLVPADQEGQRPRSRILRPHQRHRRRRRPACRPADDRHAALAGQGRRRRRRLAALRLRRDSSFPRAQVWGDVAAVARTDAAYGRRFFATGADRGSVIGSPGTDLVWAGGRLLDAWPANPDENEYNRVRDSNVGTLLIGGQLDFATPPQNATRELLPHLPNGHQVVLPKLGHADDFWAYEPDASTRLIDTYLDSGRVDTSLYTDQPARLHPVDDTQRGSPRSSSASSSASPASLVLSAPLVRPAAPPRRDVRTEDERRRAVAAPAAARLRRLVPGRADRPGRASHGSDHRRDAGRRLDRPAGRARRLHRLVQVDGAPRRRGLDRHRAAPRSAPGSATRYRTRPASAR